MSGLDWVTEMYLNSGKNSSASYTFKDGGAFKYFTKAFPVLFNDFTLPIYYLYIFNPF